MPKTRRQQAAEAANAAAPAEPPPEEDGAPAPEPPKRKTTARKPRGKKTAEAAAAEVPLGEQLAAVQAEEAAKAATPVSPAAASAAAAAAATLAVPDEDKPAAAAPNPVTSSLVTELTADALRDLPDGTDEEQVRAMLYETAVGLHGEGKGPDDLTDEEKAEIVQAVVMLLSPPPEEAPPAEEAPAAPAAAAAAPPPPSPAALLEEARRRQASSASAAAAAAASASPAGTEEEDSPLSPAKVMSIKVPITAAATKYLIEVTAKPPEPPSPGPAPMEASQASASQGSMSVESPPTGEDALSVRWYSVTEATFPEKLGERFNLILPAHKMAPISWAELKEGHATNAETYYAFTVAEAPPGSVMGSDYTLMTGDPKKVIATGVVNTHKNPTTGLLTINILDMGTREDAIPKGGAVNPYLTMAIQSIAQQMKTPTIVIRYSRKQLATDPEYLSTRNTMASLGIPLSGYTRGGPEGKEALIKTRAEEKPVDISNVKLRPSKVGADRILYEYREEGTGVVKSFSGSAVDKVYVLGRRGVEISPVVEFVGTVGAVLTDSGEDRDITLPDIVLRDGFKRVEPRRGGRKRTQRKRATSRRSS